MSQSYLIFSGDRKLMIRQGKEAGISIKSINGIVTSKSQYIDIASIIHHFEDDRTLEISVVSPEPVEIFKEVKSAYSGVVHAAGGLVQYEGRILVIFRNGKWDLPKGKVEVGERSRECAKREVMEETGLAEVRVSKKFHSTYHTYELNGQLILKETAWYLMSTGDDRTSPQTEEGITETKWVDTRDVTLILKNTYDNIALLLRAYFKIPNYQTNSK